MPCLSATSARRTGRGSANRAANSSIATQAYSALAEKSMFQVPSSRFQVQNQAVVFNLEPGTWNLELLNAAAVRVLDHVQAALLLELAGPAAGPLALAGCHRAGTRPAA